jgi:hypothetical protein
VSAKKSASRTSRPGSSNFPVAADPSRVGQYPPFTKSGAGHFYDEVLEYRVWVHPEDGAEDLHDGSDYFFAFATFDEALACSNSTAGAEEPLALVRQDEHIDQPEPGRFVHEKGERIAEWRVEWLQGKKRTADSIRDFLKARGTRG